MEDNLVVAMKEDGFKRITREEDNGCDHTSTNAPDPIRTPQSSVLGRG